MFCFVLFSDLSEVNEIRQLQTDPAQVSYEMEWYFKANISEN